MQLKLIGMIAGAIALTVTTTGLAVKAESISTSPLTVAQAQQPRGFERLELTQAQKDKIAEIRRNTRAQIEAVLTPQQQQQLKAARQDGKRRRGVFAALNLTPEQKTQMRQIRQSAKSQFEAVLTPEQLQQLRQNKQLRRQYRNQNRNFSTPSQQR